MNWQWPDDQEPALRSRDETLARVRSRGGAIRRRRTALQRAGFGAAAVLIAGGAVAAWPDGDSGGTDTLASSPDTTSELAEPETNELPDSAGTAPPVSADDAPAADEEPFVLGPFDIDVPATEEAPAPSDDEGAVTGGGSTGDGGSGDHSGSGTGGGEAAAPGDGPSPEDPATDGGGDGGGGEPAPPDCPVSEDENFTCPGPGDPGDPGDPPEPIDPCDDGTITIDPAPGNGDGNGAGDDDGATGEGRQDGGSTSPSEPGAGGGSAPCPPDDGGGGGGDGGGGEDGGGDDPVEPPPPSPELSMSVALAAAAGVGENVTARVSLDDPAGEPGMVSCISVDWGDGSVVGEACAEIACTPTANPAGFSRTERFTHAYQTAGDYEVVVYASDCLGGSADWGGALRVN
jgi:hypothetical protein